MLTRIRSFFEDRGIHPPENKITATFGFELMPVPDQVIIPLQQHIGAAAQPIVDEGDKVEEGQLIAKSDAFISACIVASVKGTITAIKDHPSPGGQNIRSIFIQTDKDIYNSKPSAFPSEHAPVDLEKYSKENIITKIKQAGIVGLGGAMFPAHVKFSTPPDKHIDTVILNGAECEPYLTCDHRIMLEAPEHILSALRIIMKSVGAKKGIIAIENNKSDAISRFNSLLSKSVHNHPNYNNIKIMALKTRYPQGAEKTLIYNCVGKEVPTSRLPLDVGVVVSNVGTAYAIYDAVIHGLSLTSRPLTISGAVKHPKNLIVRLGTTYKDVIDYCGGFSQTPQKVLSGGPMMGISLSRLDLPIVKGTSGIVVLSDPVSAQDNVCVRCGRCVDACPQSLMPNELFKYSKNKDHDKCEGFNIMDCVECGCCAYTCPARLDHLRWIRLAKKLIILKKTR